MISDFDKMTDDELHVSAIKAAQQDRLAQIVMIAHLMAVESRRLHARLGFSSIFSYAVTALGLSEPAAGQRVQAMRLAIAIPLADTKIQAGKMSVSAAASVHRFIRKEEKVNDRVFSNEEKERIISEVSGKSARETERILLGFSTQIEPHVLREKITPLTPTRTQLTFYVGPEIMADIKRVQELKGELSLEEILKASLSLYLERTDPARKAVKVNSFQSASVTELALKPTENLPEPSANASELAFKPVEALPEQSPNTSESHSSRYNPVSLLQALHRRSGSRCEFISLKTGLRCEGRFRLQVEHKIPFSHGGHTTIGNCYLFCRTHNLLAEAEVFGNERVSAFRRR